MPVLKYDRLTPSRRGRGKSHRARTNAVGNTKHTRESRRYRSCGEGAPLTMRRKPPYHSLQCLHFPPDACATGTRRRRASTMRREDAATYQFHRALITCEPAAARHGFERHGLAAFAGRDLCLLCLHDSCGHYAWDRRAEPRGSGAASSPMPLLPLLSVDGQPDWVRQSTICMQ